MQRRFRVLRVVGVVFKMLAWLSLVIGVAAAVTLAFGAALLPPYTQVPPVFLLGAVGTALVVFFGGIVLFLFLLAVGEVIFVLLAIEEHTRSAADSSRASHGPPLRF